MCVAVTSVFLASLQALPTTRIYVCMISVLAFFECGPGNEFKTSLKPNPLLGSPPAARTRAHLPGYLLAFPARRQHRAPGASSPLRDPLASRACGTSGDTLWTWPLWL